MPIKFATRLLVSVLLISMFSASFVQARELEQQVSFAIPTVVVNTSFLNVRTGPGAEFTVLVTVVGGTELPVLGVAPDGVWYQVATDSGPGWLNVSFTLPRGNFTNLPTVQVGQVGIANLGQGTGVVAAEAATGSTSAVVTTGPGSTGLVSGVSLIGRDLRQQPSFDSLILSRAVPNDPNTIRPLLNAVTVSGTTWYLVNVPGVGVGWTEGAILRVLECGNDQALILTAEAPISFDGISTQDSYLLPLDTEMFFLNFVGLGNERSRVRLADGTIGLVPTSVTAPRSDSVVSVCENLPVVSAPGVNPGETPVVVPQLAGSVAIVNTPFLNVRSGPSAGFSVVAQVSGGTEFAVLGRATDDVWLLVEFGNVRGWVNNEFTIFRGNYAAVPIIRDEVIVPLQQQVVASASGVGVASTINTTVASGQQVTGVSLIGRDLRAAPGFNSLITSRAVPNDPNVIYPLLNAQEVAGTTWYLVNIPGIGTGWTEGVELRALECGNDSVAVTRSPIPINFDGLSTQNPYLLPIGTEGYLVGQRGNFWLFQLIDGTLGLVNINDVFNRSEEVVSLCSGVPALTTAGSAVTTTATGTTAQNVVVPALIVGNRVIVNTGNLNIRSGPSAAFSVAATVAGGTELAVIGRASDDVWLYVEGSFGRGWVNSQFTLFRGNYATVPVIDVLGT